MSRYAVTPIKIKIKQSVDMGLLLREREKKTYEPASKLHERPTNQNIPAVGHEQVRSQIRPYHSSSTPAGLPRPSKQGKGGNADFDDFAQQGTQLL